jgi:hypothetical protein
MVSFGEAAEILREVGQIQISKSSVWRRVERWGATFEAMERAAATRATQLPGKGEIVPGQAVHPGRMGVAMDGAMLFILGEGWKEFKVGCLFEVEVKPTLDKHSLEWEMLGHATRNTYLGYLGNAEPFGARLWAEAQRRDWLGAQDTQVLGDAANWIWRLAELHFPDSRQTVDWYHGAQHLALAADYLYGEASTPAKQRWFNQHKLTLFQGHAARLSQTLRQRAAAQAGEVQAGLLQEAGYFQNNQHRMQYLETREEGWLIGSGMVESGAKQYKDRFTGAGMRWSRPGAERLIPIRSAVMSHTFDRLWRLAYNSPRN